MHCERCQRKIKLRVQIPGDYFCSQICFTKWSQRRNEASVKSAVDIARSVRRPRGRKSKEMAVRDGNRVKAGAVTIRECLEGL